MPWNVHQEPEEAVSVGLEDLEVIVAVMTAVVEVLEMVWLLVDIVALMRVFSFL